MNEILRHKHGLDAIFQPRSIAIVGASSDANKTGGRPVHMLVKYGYAGAIYPINSKSDTIQGLRAYASIDELPEVPDLALIVVPGAAAVAALEQAAARGVSGAVVLSAGFSEAGEEGHNLQARVTALADETGMRVVGPNCLGSLSVRERAIGTFSIALEQKMPREGGVSIVSQSGNVGSAALRMLADCGAGVARFIATGNEADIQVGDAIKWLAKDPDTDVILACIETCRNADRLIDGLSEARAAHKPVLILKIGTSEVGQKAALSHTGGLAGSDRVFDAVFAKYGAVRTHSLEQLVQTGGALSAMGNRAVGDVPSVALIAASGGFGVMMADAASSHGIAVNPLTSATQDRIKSALPLAATMNPIDATAQMSANPEVLGELLDAAMSDTSNNAVCIMLALGMEIPRLRNVFLAAFQTVTQAYPNKPLVTCISGPVDAIAELSRLGVACFPTIDAAMAGLAALGKFSTLHAKPIVHHGIKPAELPPGAFRNEATAKASLAKAGLPFPEEIVATTSDQAAQAASQIGGAVAMKILSPDIQHKSDIGGVELNIHGSDAARKAYDRILSAAKLHAPNAELDGILVSPMLTGGTELILGTSFDTTFGPTIMVGLGGIFAEVFKDTSLRLAPVTRDEALEMLTELKAFPLLDGARGKLPADIDALSHVIMLLSEFAVRHQNSVAEIDLNPVLARPVGQGVVALDALFVPSNNPKSETTE